MPYKLSQEARNDLENIWLYTFETWSLEQADRYFNSIMNEIEFLAVNPEPGKNINHIRKGYYRSQIKAHLIFYKLLSSSNEIEVIRVLGF